MTMPRVPQEVVAVAIPDEPGLRLWAEIADAARAGLPVLLTPAQVRRLIADREFLESEAYKFQRE